MNLLCALLKNLAFSARFTNQRRYNLAIAALVFTFPLYVSFLVLIFAFKKFRNFQDSERVVNNVKVFALSLAFFTYALGISVEVVI
jgi:uncharacterized membrane protein (DUF485 family)